MSSWPQLAKKKNGLRQTCLTCDLFTRVSLYKFVPWSSDHWNSSTGRKFNCPFWHQPRYKIDRSHCHFRANILHQQKSHNSQKKKVNWREQCYVSVVALSVANLLCLDKRSLVCGAGEELAEERLTLSAMKKPAYAPDLLLENCDGVVHYKPYADWLFYLALNEKTRRVSGIYPRLYLLKKKMEPFFL